MRGCRKKTKVCLPLVIIISMLVPKAHCNSLSNDRSNFDNRSDNKVRSIRLNNRTLSLPDCPCKNADLCLPIKDTTRKEVFAFSLSNDLSRWMMYDWSKLTTVVMVGYFNTELMCLAHSHNARVAYIANSYKVEFTNSTSRRSWIKEQIKLAKENFMDGLNFDFEGVIFQNDTANRTGYTDLVADTTMAFKKEFPYFQITVDVPWKQNIDSRYFDFNGLAAHSDFLFVMSYDEQSQIFGECVAGPNSGFSRTFDGVSDYLSVKINPDKMVLGVPWYGYIYPCIKQEEDKCYLKQVPFRGVNCSDAAGKEYNYGYIYSILKSHGTAGKWNASSQTPFFSYQDSDHTHHQIQYDDPKSLTLKYLQAEKLKLRGVGMWNIDALDYSNSDDGKLIREAMFGALPQYK